MSRMIYGTMMLVDMWMEQLEAHTFDFGVLAGCMVGYLRR